MDIKLEQINYGLTTEVIDYFDGKYKPTNRHYRRDEDGDYEEMDNRGYYGVDLYFIKEYNDNIDDVQNS